MKPVGRGKCALFRNDVPLGFVSSNDDGVGERVPGADM